MSDLKRFKEAQQRDFDTALSEIKSGRKRSHWMWYIFSQLAGLGMTDISKYYAITDIQVATEYLMDQELGLNLTTICKALLELDTDDAYAVFCAPDNLKLKSSMTCSMPFRPPSRFLGRYSINFVMVSAMKEL